MADTLIRLPAVLAKTGLSRGTLYLRLTQDDFPRQVRLGPRSVAWIEAEVDAWIEQKIAERDAREETP